MSTPRRLLHVFSTFAVGGPQVRFAALANKLGLDYRHRILAMDGDYAAAALLAENVDYRKLDGLRAQKNRTLRNSLDFRTLLKEEKPDLLLTYNWGAMEWALANTPSLAPQVHVEDGFGPEETRRRLARRAFFRRFALAGKSVVVASLTLKNIARSEWGIPESRLHYIPNGVDLARFGPKRESPDTLFGDPDDGPLIGTVAALRREKNLARLIEAFAMLRAKRKVRLVIVGDGSEKDALRALAASLGVAGDVFFPGRTNNPEHALGSFDLFMMSSDTEQAPVSLLEAMAAGLAVAATGVGDTAQMVSDENRAFIAPRNAGALAAAAETLLDDADLRRRVGAANRVKCVADYDFADMNRAWKKVWDGDAVS